MTVRRGVLLRGCVVQLGPVRGSLRWKHKIAIPCHTKITPTRSYLRPKKERKKERKTEKTDRQILVKNQSVKSRFGKATGA